MRCLIVLSALVAVSLCAPSQVAWEAWKLKYEKTYETAVEEAVRRNIWNENFEKVAAHNLEYELGLHTYDLEMNFMTDMTNEEYQTTYLMPAMTPVDKVEGASEHEMLPGTPSTQDWTSKGRVTGVKDQGQCGSCWSFSATGGLEGAWSASHSLVSLSEQQLVSCDTYDGGCNGGWYYNAWKYLISYGGSESEQSYPYKSGNGVDYSCEEAGKPIAATLSGYTCTTKGSESALQNAVGNIGPVSVAIDASLFSFQTYKSGVYAPSGCSTRNLDHAVLTTGYNADSQGQYWIVKNSWGTSWGQQGYIWMARNDGNMCGIANGPPCYPN